MGGGGTLDKVKEKLVEKKTRGDGQQPVKIKDMWIGAPADWWFLTLGLSNVFAFFGKKKKKKRENIYHSEIIIAWIRSFSSHNLNYYFNKIFHLCEGV